MSWLRPVGKNTRMRIALLAPTNVDLLARELERAGSSFGGVEVYTPPYGQVIQSILDPDSDVYAFSPTAVFVFYDAQDVLGDSLVRPITTPTDGVDETLTTIRSVVRELRTRLSGVTLVLNTIPLPPLNGLGGLEWNSGYGLRPAVSAYNDRVSELARETPGALVLDYEALATAAGLGIWYDRRLWYLARSRLSAGAMRSTAAACLHLLISAGRARAKCVVVDLDNTCWGGILGDDGVSGIELGSEGIGLAYADFQRTLLNLRDQGVLIAVCSKNDRDMAVEAFRTHPGMVLAESDIAAWRVNWNDKATSLREIAAELNIGTDSLVFVDDNPAERELIRQMLPEVGVIDLPPDPAGYQDAILAEPLFRSYSLTDEDRMRPAQYRQSAGRAESQLSYSNLDEYLESLNMRAVIGELDEMTLPRLAQLTQKTNQFNLRTKRYGEAELRSRVDSGAHRVFWLRLSDRFGDEGVVAVAIVALEETWFLDTFLMSCRVVGRGVEQTLMNHVLEEAAATGVAELRAEYIPTPRNGLVKDLLPKLGFRRAKEPAELWTIETGGQSVTAARAISVVTSSGPPNGQP